MTMFRLILAGLVLASPAGAEVLGCFGRSYAPEHLAANPGQQIREIRAKRHVEQSGGPEFYDLRVHFRDDPREFSAATYCEDEGGRQICMVECDGGVVFPSIDGDGRLQLRTSYLRAETAQPLPGQKLEEGGCAEPVTRSIADRTPLGDTATVFLLQPRELAECDW
ncbi:hypothetical protein [Paracoccus sp. S1E-3]|uniref:hypothetical protein n=1 Tax=Paracoccus sp. S1E-3 TaxID=2756130 RepID=UPI0015EF6798|nr:hypothetical protein [Paracoccus sp. S1E-3]MBA4489326.1 hypothetical protein [Paracoccus sp. S1E-3]